LAFQVLNVLSGLAWSSRTWETLGISMAGCNDVCNQTAAIVNCFGFRPDAKTCYYLAKNGNGHGDETGHSQA
jgi:hypothetical protein